MVLYSPMDRRSEPCATSCGSPMASSTWLGSSEPEVQALPEEALDLSNKAVVEALDGLPTHKIHCSVLAEQAVRAAVKDYYDRKGIAYDPADFPVFDEEEEHNSCDT